MKTKLLALLLMTGGFALAETHISIGIGVGPRYGYGYAPAPPRAVVAYRPPCPGPGYAWIDGYYDGYGRWFNGYWALAPYAGAYWVAPRYSGGRYYSGYWDGPRGRDSDRGWQRFREDRDHDRKGKNDRGRGNSSRGRGRR